MAAVLLGSISNKKFAFRQILATGMLDILGDLEAVHTDHILLVFEEDLL